MFHFSHRIAGFTHLTGHIPGLELLLPSSLSNTSRNERCFGVMLQLFCHICPPIRLTIISQSCVNDTNISSPVLHMQHSRPQIALRCIILLLYRFTMFVDAARQNHTKAVALFLFPLRGLLQSQPPFCSDIFSHVSDRRHRCFCSSRKIDAIRLRSNEWANTARHGCHR